MLYGKRDNILLGEREIWEVVKRRKGVLIGERKVCNRSLKCGMCVMGAKRSCFGLGKPSGEEAK